MRDYNVSDQIGLEATIDEYVAQIVAVFREVWRVLRTDGTAWVDLGDTYMSQPSWGRGDASNTLEGQKHSEVPHALKNQLGRIGRDTQSGLKPKDMCLIPFRVALALQAAGWWVRSVIVWHKQNCLPESVTDRPTQAHEYVFLLAKAERYFYDAEAIKEAASTPWHGVRGWRNGQMDNSHKPGEYRDDTRATRTRNRRSVWTIPSAGFPGSHFATFPPALVEPMIKAGTSAAGCCSACGKPWRRVIEREKMVIRRSSRSALLGEFGRTKPSGTMESPPTVQTVGWEPTCHCGIDDVVPCTVLDPFCGSGTTGLVAQLLGRRFVGLDLSWDYLQLARERTGATALAEWENGIVDDSDVSGLPLFTP